MKEIVLAGGCFWGVEHYFSLIPGIKQTKVGYANSKSVNPTYEEVCRGLTGAVEAVHLVYNSKVISLESLLSFFFRIIDPTLINQQGNDIGEQYRTGIYFTDESEKKIISNSLNELQNKYHKKIVVENLPLRNFYAAEDYHQNYLVNNPGGYCHVDFSVLKSSERKVNKKAIYTEVLNLTKALYNEGIHSLSILANTTALLKEHLPYVSWVGFYLSFHDNLILGPFQGNLACENIKKGKGVCGTSFAEEKVIIVPDTALFPGHIACDPLSRSEIVLPVYDKENCLIGVIDLDSHHYDAFDEEDKLYLEKLTKTLQSYLKNEELEHNFVTYQKLNYNFNKYFIYSHIYVGSKESRLHLFRHNYVKLLLDKGFSSEEIKDKLGEKNQSSADTYINSVFRTNPYKLINSKLDNSF